ncbi:MAG: hypothetical protein ACFFG0_04035 [Candidatus Thorarchaeota archaeon]
MELPCKACLVLSMCKSRYNHIVDISLFISTSAILFISEDCQLVLEYAGNENTIQFYSRIDEMRKTFDR